jgi:hypothetical protein
MASAIFKSPIISAGFMNPQSLTEFFTIENHGTTLLLYDSIYAIFAGPRR